MIIEIQVVIIIRGQLIIQKFKEVFLINPKLTMQKLKLLIKQKCLKLIANVIPNIQLKFKFNDLELN